MSKLKGSWSEAKEKNTRLEWKIVKYNNETYNYLISNAGNIVNSKGREVAIFMRGHRNGSYPCIHLYKDGIVKNAYIHRLVAEAFIPNPEGKPEVNHLDCDHMNANVSNLEWCTRNENMVHMHFMQGVLSDVEIIEEEGGHCVYEDSCTEPSCIDCKLFLRRSK